MMWPAGHKWCFLMNLLRPICWVQGGWNTNALNEQVLEIWELTWITVVHGQENRLRKRDFGQQWLQSRAIKPNKGMESLCSQRRPEALGCLALLKKGQEGIWLKSINTSEGVNTREGEKLFKLKDNAGKRTNGYKLAIINFGWEWEANLKPLEQQSLWNSLLQRSQDKEPKSWENAI